MNAAATYRRYSTEELESLLVHSPNHRGRASERRRALGISEYLFIGADRMPVPQAAARLGVTERTVHRYRAALRDLAGAR